MLDGSPPALLVKEDFNNLVRQSALRPASGNQRNEPIIDLVRIKIRNGWISVIQTGALSWNRATSFAYFVVVFWPLNCRDTTDALRGS
jgi:hypothetical protein